MLTKLLVRTFVKNHKESKNLQVRQSYGRLGSLVGIIVNLLLFGGKFTIGTLVGSVAVTADGVNNLSDAGSSVVSLISFRLSGKPADREHPYGHARVEYLASMMVAVLILVLGVELGIGSVEKIFAPAMVQFSWLMVAILAASIAAKLWLFLFNKELGKTINSTVMQATATDSLSDVAATSAVLLSTLVSPLLGYPLDGWMGVVVSGFILFSGWSIIREAMNKLLGDAPDLELVERIETFVEGYPGIIGTHDLIIHSYGPGRCFASLHGEVSADENILKSHDLMDNIERDILEKEGIHLVLHLDPVVHDEKTEHLRSQAEALVAELDPRLSIHDFRAVLGETHNNLIFDMVVPFEFKEDFSALQERLEGLMREKMPGCYAVVTYDRSFR